MKLADAIRKCSSIANANGPMELDSSCVAVFQNATVIFHMQLNEENERQLKIEILVGEPVRFDEKIDDLLEPESE